MLCAGSMGIYCHKMVTRFLSTAAFLALLGSTAAAQTDSPAKPMSVDDLILDTKTLTGKTVTVTGYTTCSGQNGTMCMLFDDPLNFTKNIFFNVSLMGRDDRRQIIACGLLSHCRLTIRGIVVDRPLETIELTGMDWGSGMSGRPDAEASAKPVAPTTPVTVSNFILDAAGMVDRTVTVTGGAQCDGNACWLTEMKWTQSLVVPFDGNGLSRDDRKKLLGCDQVFSGGCSAEVTGTVKGGSVLTLVAASIVWR